MAKKRRNSRSPFGTLCPDIVEGILRFLDAKPVNKWKDFSDSWLSRISSPSFMNLHHKNQEPRTLLLLDDLAYPEAGALFWREDLFLKGLFLKGLFLVRYSEICDQIRETGGHVPNHHGPPFVVGNIVLQRFPLDLALAGSQNGVLCLFEKSSNDVYLWNPAIKEIKKLPPTPRSSNSDTNSVDIKSIYGFGYEPKTNDFKVVAVSAPRQLGSLNFLGGSEQVGVYSLGSNSWTSMEMPGQFSRLVGSSPYLWETFFVVLCGSIHWLLALGGQWNVTSIKIVAFDLSTEKFKLIDVPKSVAANKVQSISVLSGCLSLLTFDRPGLIEIWEMKKYGAAGSWTKRLPVDLLRHPVPSFQSNFFRPRGVLHDGNLLLDSGERLCFYDTESNRDLYLCPWKSVVGFANYAESIFLSKKIEKEKK